MGIADSNGRTARSRGPNELSTMVVLAGLQKRFQTRIYRLDAGLNRTDNAGQHRPDGSCHTHRRWLEGARRRDLRPARGRGSAAHRRRRKYCRPRRLGHRRRGVAGAAQPSSAGACSWLRPERSMLGCRTMEEVSISPTAVANARITSYRNLSAARVLQVRRRRSPFATEIEPIAARRGHSAGETARYKPSQSSSPPGPQRPRALRFAVESAAPVKRTSPTMPSPAPSSAVTASAASLYVEGEPRWEFKFIRRAEDDRPDGAARLYAAHQREQGLSPGHRATQRTGRRLPGARRRTSSPTRASSSARWMQTTSRRCSRSCCASMSTGVEVECSSWGPVFACLTAAGPRPASEPICCRPFCPSGRSSFHRNAATVELTSAGVDSPITRLLDDPTNNAARWKKLTYLADYEEPGSPKPGATVLGVHERGQPQAALADHAELRAWPHGYPGDRGHLALADERSRWATQRTTSSGSSFCAGWSPTRLVRSSPPCPSVTLMDQGLVRLSAQVRDRDFQPATNAHVTAHIVGPRIRTRSSTSRHHKRRPALPGRVDRGEARRLSRGDHGRFPWENQRRLWAATSSPSSAKTVWRRTSMTVQNRPLLEQLAAQTGGRYWKPGRVKGPAA